MGWPVDYPVLVGGQRQTTVAGQRAAFRRADDELSVDALRADQVPAYGFAGLANSNHFHAAQMAAHKAWPGWAATDPVARLGLVSRVHTRLLEQVDGFVHMLVAEGRPVTVARTEATAALRLLGAGQAVQAARDLLGCEEIGQRRVPVGVVAMRPPRYTTAVYAAAVVWALATGNSVVLNVPERQPMATLWLFHEVVLPAMADVGAPVGLLSVLCAPRDVAWRAWTSSTRAVDAVWIGGHMRTLWDLFDDLDGRVRRIGDMSACDTALVWRDADLDAAVAALSQGMWASGTFAVGPPRYAVVHADVAEQLVDALTEQARSFVLPGVPSDEATRLTRLPAPIRFPEHVEQAMKLGAVRATGGMLTDRHGNPHPLGVFGQPTVLWAAVDSPAARVTFGPPHGPDVTVAVLPKGGDDVQLELALRWINGNPAGRNLFVQCADVTWAADRVAARVHAAARVKVNQSPSAVAGMGLFGGVGAAADPEGGSMYPWRRTTQTVARPPRR